MNTLSKYSNTFMTVLMLVIFTTLVVIASQYPPGARFMPFVIGFPAIALCLLQLFLDARERRLAQQGAIADEGLSDIARAELQVSAAAGKPVHFDVGDILMAGEKELPEGERLKREAIAWGYFLGLIGGILLFGFHAAVPTFLLTFLRFRAKTSWLVAAGSAVAASAVLFFAFEYVLRIELFSGFVTDRIKDVVGGG